jgi:hypothetical protein
MNADSAAKTPLGRIGVFLLPSLKMKSVSPRGKTYDQELHDFLIDHFSGYTVTAGNISGYWKTNGYEQYGEHREYKVAFEDDSKIEVLEKHIADLGAEIGEEMVYCELGNRAVLIHGEKCAG